MMYDNNFLVALSEQQHQEKYARIIAFDINGLPIDQIEGKITGGSINVDGSSAVRRTCSLTMVSEDVDINSFYWGVKTRFKLEVGLRNQLSGDFAPAQESEEPAAAGSYPEIVWFPQGYYVISSFNTSASINNCTISLQGKDKMCLLNGDLGGQLYASIDFGTEEVEEKKMEKVEFDSLPVSSEELMKSEYYYKDNNDYKKIKNPNDLFLLKEQFDNYLKNTFYYKKYGEDSKYYELDSLENERNTSYYKLKDLYQPYTAVIKEKIPIDRIIREAVHTYAQEPYHNIIINDLEEYGLEQMTSKLDKTLYALYNTAIGEFDQLVLEGKIDSLDNAIDSNFIFYTDEEHQGDSILLNNNPIEYKVMKIEFGDDLGYRLTELIYPDDLISNVGDSLVTILDKIKTMLGNFEYFYDLDGRFIFQEKPNYVNNSWNPIEDDGESLYVDAFSNKNKFSYSFEGNRLITAIQNSPVINNLRNDFVVWGQRKTTSDAEVPIHMRYAIDKKPSKYVTLEGKVYENDQYDWRELIYQMALDYFKGQGCSENNPINIKDANNNTLGTMTSPDDFLYWVGQQNSEFYSSGYTGYEQYYTDIEGFWRQLYNPDYIPEAVYEQGYYKNQINMDETTNISSQQKVWVEPQLIDYDIEYYIPCNIQKNTDGKITGYVFSNIYYTQYQTILNKIANIANDSSLTEEEQDNQTEYYTKLKEKYESYAVNRNDEKFGWNINVLEHPENLNFWIDFMGDGMELAKYSVSQVGDRTKVVNENNVKAIAYKEIPKFILYEQKDENGVLINNTIRREIPKKAGYKFIFLPKGYSQYFSISYRGLSAKDKIDELLYQHSYCTENITLTTIPVYHLEPNTRIKVQDDETNINGEYIINRMTIPLTYNGTMSIMAVKAPERIY